MTIYQCLYCLSNTKNPKFCSRSCSASYNNKGVKRHGNSPKNCLVCGNKTSSARRKYCSTKCSGIMQIKHTKEDRKRLNREHFMRYYMRKKKQTPTDADFTKIKEIYLNCPKGYEVDHIIPVSLGGLHHQDNLQYLTISENRRKGNRLDWYSLEESNLVPSFPR